MSAKKMTKSGNDENLLAYWVNSHSCLELNIVNWNLIDDWFDKARDWVEFDGSSFAFMFEFQSACSGTPFIYIITIVLNIRIDLLKITWYWLTQIVQIASKAQRANNLGLFGIVFDWIWCMFCLISNERHD